MAIDTKFTKFLDPLDFGGSQSSVRTVAEAEKNAALLREFSDITQANLQPFLDLAAGALPGLEQGATPEGFFAAAEELRPFAEQLAAPVVEEETERLTAGLAARGLTRTGGAISAAADIQEQADLSALLQLQNLITGRQQQIAGFGEGTGESLARLGQQSAEQIAGIRSGGVLRGAQAQAAGQQNLINLAGLGISSLDREPV